MVDIVDLISSTFKRNKKSREVKILAVLEYMFRGSCRKTSKVLGAAFGPIAKPTVHELAKKISEIKLAEERKERLVMAVDQTKLKVEGQEVYVWAAVDADTKELLAMDAPYQRSSLNAYLFLNKALGKCKNKPTVLVDGGPWYTWALQRLGLLYVRGGFGARSSVERFFRYLKERTAVFYHRLSARNYYQGLMSLKMFLGLFSMYYKPVKWWPYPDTISY